MAPPKKNDKKKEHDPSMDANVVSSLFLEKQSIKLKSALNRVIRRSEAPPESLNKVQIVGGDTDDVTADPPAIVIEKENDQIKKIIVKCPCGRHAELLCEYE